jgi:hypothetical protein
LDFGIWDFGIWDFLLVCPSTALGRTKKMIATRVEFGILLVYPSTALGSTLPQMAMESIFVKNTIFCWPENATEGSAFRGVQKKGFWKNLGMYSWK